MSSQALAVHTNQSALIDPKVLEQVLLGGDLAGLNPASRLSYYKAVCDSVGLNPLTKPFDYLQLDGKLVLYAKKDCTDQLRSKRNISVKFGPPQVVDNIFIVTALGKAPDGREDEDVGCVPLVKENGTWEQGDRKRYFKGNGTFSPLNPEGKSNAMMKAHTKAKRRVTLSICGLGIIDESEIESLPEARVVSAEIVETDPQGSQAAADAVGKQKLEDLRKQAANTAAASAPASTVEIVQPANARVAGYWKRMHSKASNFLNVFEELEKEMESVTGDQRNWFALLQAEGCATANDLIDSKKGGGQKKARTFVEKVVLYLEKCTAPPPPSEDEVPADPAPAETAPVATDEKSDWLPENMGGGK